MLRKSSPKREPVWQKQVPAIRVRENMKTTYVQLSSMHGDRLPKLRTIARPECSDQARHFKNVSESSMTKNVNIMYREHQYTMKKLEHSQDSAFKVMCRVKTDKRNAQRAVCMRRHMELRGKMKSHPIRALLLNEVTNFTDNTANKKEQIEHAPKEIEGIRRESKSSETEASIMENEAHVKSDESHANTMSRQSPIQAKLSDEQSKVYIGTVDAVMDKKTHIEKISEHVVPTAGHIDIWCTYDKSESDTRKEVNTQRRTSKGLAVATEETKSVKERKESVIRVSRRVTGSSESDTDGYELGVKLGVPDIQFTVESRVNSFEKSVISSGELILGTCDDGRDYGWFTVGNPKVDTAPEHVDTYGECSGDKSSQDTHSRRRITRSLPPLKRKRGVAQLPDGFLREQMATTTRDGSGRHTSPSSSVQRRRLPSIRRPGELDDVPDLSRTRELAKTNLIPVAHVYVSTKRTAAGKSHQPSTEGERDAVSEQTVALLSNAPLVRPEDDSGLSLGKLQSEGQEPIITDRSMSSHVVTALQTRRLPKNKNNGLSANMMWVLKQEDKSRKRWQKHMSEEDVILKYHRDNQGKLVAKVSNVRTQFYPPSRQEQYRQKKLLVGEKVLKWEFRERIQQFYQNIIPLSESSRPVIVDLPSLEVSPSKQLQSVSKPHANKSGRFLTELN